MTYQPRVTEDGSYRITEDGAQLTAETSSGSDVPSEFTDIGAKINVVPNPGKNLEASVIIGDKPYPKLGAKLIVPAIVSTDTPTLIWLNSSDFDGDNITYEVQLAPDFDWDGPNAITESNIQENPSGITRHQISTAIQPDIIYNWRVRAFDGYEYSEWSEPLGVLYALNIAIFSDINARVRIPTRKDLGAKLFVYRGLKGRVTIPTLSDLGASVYVDVPYSNLGASLTIPTLSDLGARLRVITVLKARVTIPPYSDLGAKFNIIESNHQDLNVSVKIVDKYYTNLLAQIFVDGTSDLGGSTYIVPYVDLGAKVRVETVLKAKLFIPAYRHIQAQANIETDLQHLQAKVTVIRRELKDLNASVVVGKFIEDINASVDVSTSLQEIKASLNVIRYDSNDIGGSVAIISYGSSDLSGYINVRPIGVNFDASVNVTVEHQMLGGSLTVIQRDTADVGASVNVDVTNQMIFASATIQREDTSDIFATVGTIANRPDAVVPSGYVPPSGYPPLPEDWKDENGNALPPSGAVVVPSGVWQQEEEILFIWDMPDWGYEASADGFMVAWNDEENYEVSQSDQYVPNNYIQKNWYDGGSMWFHIRARNSYGYMGPQASYNIKINTIPTVPPDPMYIDNPSNDTGTTGCSSPEFYWGKSYDADQLDIISYELQVWPQSSGPDNPDCVYIQNIQQTGTGSMQYFKMPQYMAVGRYDWRVRAYDNKQFSEWSHINPLIVSPVQHSLGAKITIPVYDVDNLLAKINILPYNDLSAVVNVTYEVGSNLGASINVCYKYDSEIKAKISIASIADIGATVTIRPYERLGASLRVVGVPGRQDIYGKVKVCDTADDELKCRLRVCDGSSVELGAFLHIISNVDVGGRVTVYTKEHFGFIEDFRDDILAQINIIQRGERGLAGIVDVEADKPGAVIIDANVPEAEWNPENNITFTWSPATAHFNSIDGYYIQLDRQPDSQASVSWQNNNLFTYSINLETLTGAGIYYFHVAALASNGMFGPTAHYAVWYNHKPQKPEVPMTINDKDTISDFAIVSAHSDLEFRWEQSYDEDQLDIITYRLQIANNETFIVDNSQNYDIIYDLDDIETFYHQISGGTIESGTYFWRVRAFDGHEWSEWSRTGRFYINTPPTAPQDLTVYR